MIKLSVIPLMLLLSGCTILGSLTIPHYDSGEYQSATNVRTLASIASSQCSDYVKSKANAELISVQTQYLEFYQEKIAHNENAYKAAQSLNQIAQSLKKRYAGENKPSQVYCEVKFKSIEASSSLIQQAAGARPR